MIEQEAAVVVAFRPNRKRLRRRSIKAQTQSMRLGEISTELPLAEIYEDIEFSQELTGDEDD